MTDSSLSYTSIIAAAGVGTAMGGPEALLAVRWGDETGELPLGIAHARAHLDFGAQRVVLVVRSKVAKVLSGFAQRGLDLVVSTREESEGARGSIRTALELVSPSGDDWIMIEPVGMPPSSSAIRRELLAGAETNPAAVRPVFDGRRGHPVLVRARFLEPLVRGDAESLRAVLDDLAERAQRDPTAPQVVDVPVTDRRAITAFDVPADLEAFYGRPTKFFLDDEPTFG